MAKKTPVVIAFTPDYFVPAATTVKSLLDSSFGDFEIICLVTEDVPARMKRELEDLSSDRLSFKYINLKGQLKGAYISDKFTEAASFRLLLPDVLPDYDKVVYMDCDIISRTDVAELFNETDLGDNLLAAVYMAPIEDQAEKWEKLGCDPYKYFNSGFLLMNLKLMREEGTVQKLLDASHVSHLDAPDQDVLNIVCKDRILPLPPFYNAIRPYFIPKFKAEFRKLYSQAEWFQIQDRGTIHYTEGKPWNLFSVKFWEWWKTYYTLPKSIRSEWEPRSSMVFIYKIYKTGPGKWAIDTAQKIYRFFRNALIK